MAYSRLQSVKADSAAAYVNSLIATLPNPTANGSLIVVTIHTSSGTANNVTAVTDDAASTYNKAGSFLTNNRVIDIWYAYNVGSITTNKIYVANADYVQTHVHAREYSGMLTTAAVFDKVSNQGDDTYVNVHSADIVPSAVGNLLVAAYVGSNGAAIYSTSGTSTDLLQAAFDYVSAASYTAPATTTGTQTQDISSTEYEWGALAIASFVPAPTAPTTPTKRFNGTAFVNTVAKRKAADGSWVDLVGTKK